MTAGTRGDGTNLLAGADIVVKDPSETEVPSDARGRTIDTLPTALDRMEAIVREIGEREVVFFLDFDGTLAPIVDRPGDAALPPASRDLLADLASRRGVAVVSGRDLDDLRERVGLGEVYYAGSHGFRLAGPDGFRRELEEARRFLPALDVAEEQLRARLAAIPGVEVERKHYAIAVHFRRADEGGARDARRVAEDAQQSHRELRLGEGRKVLELRPAIDWDKGKAIDWLLQALGLEVPRVFPIYIGDDVTDEDAFRAIGTDGMAIVVRGRCGCTQARYSLEDPTAVRRFLAQLDEALGPR